MQAAHATLILSGLATDAALVIECASSSDAMRCWYSVQNALRMHGGLEGCAAVVITTVISSSSNMMALSSGNELGIEK